MSCHLCLFILSATIPGVSHEHTHTQGKDGGKVKPLKKPKTDKELDDDDIERKKKEAAAKKEAEKYVEGLKKKKVYATRLALSLSEMLRHALF
jgi:Translation machinery associated TMA7